MYKTDKTPTVYPNNEHIYPFDLCSFVRSVFNSSENATYVPAILHAIGNAINVFCFQCVGMWPVNS